MCYLIKVKVEVRSGKNAIEKQLSLNDFISFRRDLYTVYAAGAEGFLS